MTEDQRALIEKYREEDRESERAFREEYASAPVGPDGRKRDRAGRVMDPDGHRYYLEGEPRWSPPPRTLPQDPREAPPELHATAAGRWDDIVTIGGDPALLMRAREMWRYKRNAIADWVRNLEHLVRYIVLIAALTLAPLAPGKACVRPRSIPPYRRQWPDDPLTWRVAFGVLTPAPRPSRYRFRRNSKQPHPRDAVSVRGLALRMEALRRVLSDVQARARACRRTLDRIAARNRGANAPREVQLRWFCAGDRPRSRGEYAMFGAKSLAYPLAFRLIERWNVRQWEPG